jgi:NAD(P)-dependent dehydrogenase (short-subunit alcohol dehydrogenase family)
MSSKQRAKTLTLDGKVALVAGATRGAGRGIARALGEAGATVYCTGRSVRGKPSAYGRTETIDETADLVTRAGGRGIAIRVDHAVEAEVKALFDRIGRDEKRLDVVADSVGGEDAILGGWGSFWETDLTNGAEALRNALLSHVITAKYAALSMIENKKRGLIAQVTEGDTLGGVGNALKGLVKGALKEMSCRLAEEIRPHRVTSVAITPGYLRSETMLEQFGVTEANWRDGGKKDPNFLESESPLFVGRAVAALAADPNRFERTGDILSSWELARDYDFTDADGRRPDWGAHFAKTVVPSMAWMKEAFERNVSWLERQTRRAKAYVGGA